MSDVNQDNQFVIGRQDVSYLVVFNIESTVTNKSLNVVK